MHWDAAEYEAASEVQLAWGRRLLEKRAWRGDEVVLDAGCGPGILAAEIAGRLPRGRVVAADIDPSMVERARQRLAPLGARASVVQADLLALGDLGPFDVIFSNAVFHWIDDHDGLFESLLHHLRPGGALLAQFGGEGNLARVRGVANELVRSPEFAPLFPGWKPPWRYEDDASTQERLLIAGFVDPKVTLEEAPVTMPDAESFERFLRAVVLRAYLVHLPDESARTRFVRAFLAAVEGRFPGRRLDYVRLTVSAARSPHG